MNLYVRYFDEEALVDNVDEAIQFLSVLPEIDVTPELEAELREYAASSQNYPKRCKVGARQYFIVIKTEARTMQDFKDKKALRNTGVAKKEFAQQKLNEIKPGWYRGTLEFKRVIVNHQGKCEYRDTTFVADCKVDSAMDCYNMITRHLQQRVDKRSQFPSAKGKNFKCDFLGLAKESKAAV